MARGGSRAIALNAGPSPKLDEQLGANLTAVIGAAFDARTSMAASQSALDATRSAEPELKPESAGRERRIRA
jgi:hypothetical protein